MYIFYWPYYFGLFLKMQHRFDRILLSNKARVHADQKLNQVERVIITIYINQNVLLIVDCTVAYHIQYTFIYRGWDSIKMFSMYFRTINLVNDSVILT